MFTTCLTAQKNILIKPGYLRKKCQPILSSGVDYGLISLTLTGDLYPAFKISGYYCKTREFLILFFVGKLHEEIVNGWKHLTSPLVRLHNSTRLHTAQGLIATRATFYYLHRCRCLYFQCNPEDNVVNKQRMIVSAM